MLVASDIVALHDYANALGHNAGLAASQPRTLLETLVQHQHQANFDLWHEEDRARDPDAPDSEIARIKHSIDHLNQIRNDLVEQIDALLIDDASQNPDAPLHSETPGLIIDRLSILSLKVFHTREESLRKGATEEHHQRNAQRLAVLEEQRSDLAAALKLLWTDIQAGRRRFKLYRQLKMYNDAALNPVLYRKSASGQR